MLKRSKDFICPLGKEVLKGDHSSLDSFPPNYTARDLIEKSLEHGICNVNQKELQYVCAQDKIKVCNECVIFGEHKSHDIKPLSELGFQIEKKIQKLQDLLQSTEKYQKDIEKTFEEQRISMINTVI